jgi:hypothetical protein
LNPLHLTPRADAACREARRHAQLSAEPLRARKELPLHAEPWKSRRSERSPEEHATAGGGSSTRDASELGVREDSRTGRAQRAPAGDADVPRAQNGGQSEGQGQHARAAWRLYEGVPSDVEEVVGWVHASL